MKQLIFLLSLCLASLTACQARDPAKHAVLQELNGATINFAELKGKWVIINYWASWCHPCNDEIPELNAFYEKNKDKDVMVIGVNYDNVDPTQLKKIIAAEGITYPNLSNDPRLTLGLGDIPGLPATYVFGPDGKLKDKLFGQQTRESLQQAIQVG